MSKESNPQISGKEFTITRTFNAPCSLVFKAWINAEGLACWWGPKGFTLNVKKLDLSPGGMFLYSMTPPKGDPIWGRFIYREIKSPERLVFINSFSDEEGNITRNPWIGTWPLEIHNTVIFTEQNGKTSLTIKAYPINANEEECRIFEENISSMQNGFAGTFEKLDEYIASSENNKIKKEN
jgi:uncharacterized protein YndB with AHSA1/START domain